MATIIFVKPDGRGLDPRIHQEMSLFKTMDCRVKPGNDEGESACHLDRL
jgi:hypothetical protein